MKTRITDTERLDWLLKFLKTSTIEVVEANSAKYIQNAKFDFDPLDRSGIDAAIRKEEK